MGVTRIVLQGFDWVIWMIGWWICLPMRIVYSLLRTMSPKLVSSMGFPDKKRNIPRLHPPPDFQTIKQQYEYALKDKVRADNNYAKERRRANELKKQCEDLANKIKSREEKIKKLENKSLQQNTTNVPRDSTETDAIKKRYEATIQGLEEELGKLKEELKQSRDSHRCNIEQKDELLNGKDDKLEVLTREKDELASFVQATEDGLKTVKQQITKLQKELQDETIKYEEVENEKQLLTTQISQVEKQNIELVTSLKQTEADKDGALRRLSEIMSLRLRDNNPNIVDLNDQNRPTKLAEMMNELYDNQWTDAFAYIEEHWEHDHPFSEITCIEFLLNILMETYTFCRKKVEDDWTDGIRKILWTTGTDDEKEVLKTLKDMRRKNALTELPNIEKLCVTVLQTTKLSDDTGLTLQPSQDELINYVRECVKLCWLMSLQDPPVHLVCVDWTSQQNNTDSIIQNALDTADSHNFPQGESNDRSNLGPNLNTVNHLPNLAGDAFPTENNEDLHDDGAGSREFARGDSINTNERTGEKRGFEKDLYREYTKRGKYVEYIVWPLMYLYENGPVLNKGVAQGCDS